MNIFFKKTVVIIAILTAYCSSICAQNASYQVSESELSSSTNVKLKMLVYGKSKKTIDVEAQCAALRVVLFEGCQNTPYTKALMKDGEITSIEKYPHYFEDLYCRRYSDFINFYRATSAFKKGDDKKGTEYIIEVKVLNLRKDLEKNGIKRNLGL